MIKNFKIQLLLLVVSNFFFTACPDPRECSKPEPDQKTIKIPIRMPLNSTVLGCQFLPGSLLADFNQKGNNALTSSFKNKKDEWLIEATVFGSCGGNTAWKSYYKFADLSTLGTAGIDEKGTVSTTMIDNAQRMVLEFPKIPVTTGKVTFDVQIHSPCVSCSTSPRRSMYAFSVEVEFPPMISGSQHTIDIRNVLYSSEVEGVCK